MKRFIEPTQTTMRTKYLFYIVAVMLFCSFQVVQAQETARPFEGEFYNEEYQVSLHLNFHDKDIEIKGQEYLGQLPGYFSAKRDTRLWLIVEAEIVNEKTAHATFINDFGSEDFEAEITIGKDGSLTLKRINGSTLKIVVNSKYVKLPKSLVFLRRGL